MKDKKATVKIKKKKDQKKIASEIMKVDVVKKAYTDKKTSIQDQKRSKNFFSKNLMEKRLLKKRERAINKSFAPKTRKVALKKKKVKTFRAKRTHDKKFLKKRTTEAYNKIDTSDILNVNFSDKLTTKYIKELYKDLPLLSPIEAKILFIYLETSNYAEVSKIAKVSVKSITYCLNKPVVQEYLRIHFAEQQRLHQILNLRSSWEAVFALRNEIKIGSTEEREVLSPTGAKVMLKTKKSPSLDAIKFLLDKSGLMPHQESQETKDNADRDKKLGHDIDIHLNTVIVNDK